jgi:hypothetical protein
LLEEFEDEMNRRKQCLASGTASSTGHDGDSSCEKKKQLELNKSTPVFSEKKLRNKRGWLRKRRLSGQGKR